MVDSPRIVFAWPPAIHTCDCSGNSDNDLRSACLHSEYRRPIRVVRRICVPTLRRFSNVAHTTYAIRGRANCFFMLVRRAYIPKPASLAESSQLALGCIPNGNACIFHCRELSRAARNQTAKSESDGSVPGGSDNGLARVRPSNSWRYLVGCGNHQT